MDVIQTSIPGVVIIEPKLFGDHRGFFLETFQGERYASHGIRGPFVQDNLSRSARGVVRGLHLQNPNPQGKLVMVLRGRVLDVAVDVRIGSPTFGHHVATEINDENHRQRRKHARDGPQRSSNVHCSYISRTRWRDS